MPKKGYKQTPEHIWKLSEARKGRIHSDETRQQISETLKGRTFSAEHRQKMSISQKKRYHIHPKGPVSEETKQKISESEKGKTLSDETRQKQREAHKRTWQDPDFRETQFRTNPWFRHNIERPTSIERAIQEELIRRNIYDFIPEFYVSNGNGGYYFVDFMIVSNFTIIECDGDYWHTLEGAKERDAKRQEDIESKGWTVLRFTGTQIRTDLQEVGNKIVSVLAGAE